MELLKFIFINKFIESDIDTSTNTSAKNHYSGDGVVKFSLPEMSFHFSFSDQLIVFP